MRPAAAAAATADACQAQSPPAARLPDMLLAVPLLLLTQQVFEYLTTDLKKYMDRNGKGPNYPLPKPTIKVTVVVVVWS
jgi:hypothetical protein